MMKLMDNDISRMESRDSGRRSLYTIGAFAALLATFVFRRNLSAELAASGGFGLFDVPKIAPASAADWFALLQRDGLVGLTLLDLFNLAEYALVGLLFLALYAALKQANRSTMLLAAVCTLVGISVAFATNQAIALLALSAQHAAAATDTQRAMFLAAGEALLAINTGPGGYISLFLVLLAGLLISVVMLQSNVFGRTTSWIGILANGIGLCFFITLPLGPVIYWLPPTLSAPFRLIWYFLMARKLLQLRKDIQ